MLYLSAVIWFTYRVLYCCSFCTHTQLFAFRSAQSSTPQTTVLQIPPSSDSGRRSRNSPKIQCDGSVVVSSAPAAAAFARSSRSTKKVKANEMEGDQQQQAGSRKKGKTSSTDQRWSKRFTWPDEVGIKETSVFSFRLLQKTLTCAQHQF